MESERERLERLYRELGDEHLRDLAEEPEDLTGDARTVLAAEMRRRGFAPGPPPPPQAGEIAAASAGVEREAGFSAGIPGIFPSSAALVETALEPGGEQREGWVGLVTLYDGHELTRAAEALSDSGVEFALEEKAGDALVGAPGSFEIWVEARDVDLAQRVLRQKLALFPVSESEGADDEAGSALLGTFETRAEAEQARQVLLEAGIRSTLTEPGTDSEERWWTVEVDMADQDRALRLLADRLELEP